MARWLGVAIAIGLSSITCAGAAQSGTRSIKATPSGKSALGAKRKRPIGKPAEGGENDPLPDAAPVRRRENIQENWNCRSYHDPALCTASDTLMVAGMSPISLKVSAILCCSSITSLLIGRTSKPL